MATTTSPDNIFVLETSDNDTPSSWQPAMATSVQAALLNRALNTYRWANATERAAQTGMSEGDYGDQADNDTLYRYDGSAWSVYPPAIPDTGWINATLVNSWVTNGGLTPRYRRYDGEVFVEGQLTGGSANSVMFTLPSGFRPTTDLKRFVTNTDGTAYYRALIGTDGTVRVSNSGSSATPALGFSFLADA